MNKKNKEEQKSKRKVNDMRINMSFFIVFLIKTNGLNIYK